MDFDNTWNDHQEFDDMDLPRQRSELNRKTIKVIKPKER